MVEGHAHSLLLEHVVRRALQCERWGLGGIVHADAIDVGGAYTAMAVALAPYYAKGSTAVRSKIDNLLEVYTYLDGVDSKEWGEEIKKAANDLNTLLDEITKTGTRLELE